METIMSTISSTADRYPDAGGSAPATAVAALQRLWRAYVKWHLEQAAIMLLGSMSDRELADLGLARSEIASAVRGRAGRRDG
jgi:uncharacterized protein YjiS (DUF1127 family)